MSEEITHRCLLTKLRKGSEEASRLLAAVEVGKLKHVERQLDDLSAKLQTEEKTNSLPSYSEVAVEALQKAIRRRNKDIFVTLIKECGPLSLHVHHEDTDGNSGFAQHGVSNDIANAIVESLVTCSEDCSVIVRALIEHGFDLRGSHDTLNGRRLWFWAALKDHENMVSHMLAAGFPLDQGIQIPDQLSLAKTLAHDSNALPHGITALFAALIANSYQVALHLIQCRAALKLHFHEQRDAYTVAASGHASEANETAIVVDAMMVLAPKFVKTYPAQRESIYLEVVKALMAYGLDANLPSNLWIKASSIFFMSLSQGHPSQKYVQEIPFVSKVALHGDVEVLKLLISKGADIEAKGFDGLSLLHFATRSTKLDMVEYVAELIDDIDLQDDYGYSALHHAVALDLPEIVSCLLDWDADIDQVSKIGLSPLHLAVSLKNIEMCELLLEQDADVNTSLDISVTKSSFKHATDWSDLTRTEMVFGSTPLMSALCPDKMAYSISIAPGEHQSSPRSGSSTTDSDDEDESSSSNDTEESLSSDDESFESRKKFQGSESGIRIRLINILLRHGAQACDVGFFFKRRLDLARKPNDRDWESSPFAYEVEWCYPLSVACKTTTEAWSLYTMTSLRKVRGTPDVVRTMLAAVGSKLTPHVLSEAFAAACLTESRMNGDDCGHGYFKLSRPTIGMLLNAGADPNQRNNQGLTLLHLACLPWEKGTDQSNLVDQVLQKGAYIEARCPKGRTALHWAAAWDLSALKILLDRGADTCVCDETDRTPLHFACDNAYPRDSRRIQMLLKHKHLRESKSGDETQLVMACDREWDEESCELLHYLIDSELPQHTNAALLMACRNDRIESLKTICKHSQPWRAYSLRDHQSVTPLIEAVKNGSAEMVSLILRGISIAYRDQRNLAPDVFHDYDEEFTEELSREGFKSVYKPPPYIEGLLFPNQYFHKGQLVDNHRSPTSSEVTGLDSKARIACLNARDHHGWTALHYAVAGSNEKIVNLLVQEPDIDLEPSSGPCYTPLDILRASGKTKMLQDLKHAIKFQRSGSTDLCRATDEEHRSRAKGFRELTIPANPRASLWHRARKTQLRMSKIQIFQVVIAMVIILCSLWSFAFSNWDGLHLVMAGKSRY